MSIKNIKTYGELEQYAKVNGYGPRSFEKLKKEWEESKAIPTTIPLTIDDEH